MIYASCSTSSSHRIGRKKFGRRYGDDFRELEGKRVTLTVVFHHNDVKAFQKIWKNIYFESSKKLSAIPLKHARAQQMDVSFASGRKQLHLRMVDDGIGFEQEKLERLSYGLKIFKNV